MTPVIRCLSRIDRSTHAPDGPVAPQIAGMLDELESAYRRPSDRIVALEALLQEFRRTRQADGTRLERFLRLSVDRRQSRLARKSRMTVA